MELYEEFRNALMMCSVSFSCLVNDTEELGPLMSLNISADSNKLHLQDLEALSKYKFYLRCCTRVGCGPAASEERTTVPEASEYGGAAAQGWGLLRGVSLWHSKGQGIWLSDMDDQVAVVMGIDPANTGTLFRPPISPSFSYAHLSISL